MKVSQILYLVLFLFCIACNSTQTSAPTIGETLFTEIPAGYTQIDFVNQLTYDEAFNAYTYRNFYNGGGVGLGDVNNDGLVDIYFCGNMVDNRLYLNKGNFQFEDITQQAGVACPNVWSSGVSFADVNGDGWLDIYVCKSGKPEGGNRNNELFINNGDLTFTEQAEAWGIADKGLSSHAAFFDYDKDGDLDCYLLNNSFRSVGGYDLIKDQREIIDPEGGNKLYRNDGSHFTNVIEEAGIYGSAIGFGLGVTIGDINGDSWLDIYVSNDFFERDYLYINQKNGTFAETLVGQMPEISLSSMGADMADINNDGLPEVFVTDMLPEDDARMKTKTTFENWDKYQRNVKTGYHHQFTRNVLQLNNGNGTFSEIGRLANVYATDWSWGALIMDLDNDGLKDIFVANGIYKDLTDQDYLHYFSDPNTVRDILKREGGVIKKLIDGIPSVPLPNYAFVNNGDLTFSNRAAELGLGKPSFSNGSVYGDLDNDGDLDLVVNNVNMPPFIYRCETRALNPENHYLSLELVGQGKNTFALGAQVKVYANDQLFYQELAPMRGFQSCVDHRLHFGLGAIDQIDSVVVQWPDNQTSILKNVPVDQRLKIAQKDAYTPGYTPVATAGLNLFQKTDQLGIDYRHQENNFIDFDRDALLYHMLSSEGPRIAVGDVNGDGRQDFFVGGAKDAVGGLYIQSASGKFVLSEQMAFTKDIASEDTDGLFFDADNDGDQDLYVASGGSEFPASSIALADRLYFNNGRGQFTKGPQLLPAGKAESTACISAADFDQDGDLDLFVGLRLRPFLYGVPVNGYLLENDGNGQFQDVTADLAPALQEAGMITDGIWLDIDQDRDEDLLVCGEWMPIRVFQNNGGQFTEISEAAGLNQSNGFWNCLKAADLDQDGDLDLVAGNHGKNTRLKAQADRPASMYVNDFDQNGTAEQVISVFNGDASYPLALRHDLVKQMPGLNKKYLKYESYKEQTVEDIFSQEQLAGAVKWVAFNTNTSVWLNDGKGQFTAIPLPVEAQFAPVFGLQIADFDQDNHKDLLIAGNFSRAKPEVGMYHASYGLFLKGDGTGQFNPVPNAETGLLLDGEVRDLQTINVNGQRYILVANNDGPLEVLRVN